MTTEVNLRRIVKILENILSIVFLLIIPLRSSPNGRQRRRFSNIRLFIIAIITGLLLRGFIVLYGRLLGYKNKRRL